MGLSSHLVQLRFVCSKGYNDFPFLIKNKCEMIGNNAVAATHPQMGQRPRPPSAAVPTAAWPRHRGADPGPRPQPSAQPWHAAGGYTLDIYC